MIAGMICSAKTNLGTISQSGILNFFFFYVDVVVVLIFRII